MSFSDNFERLSIGAAYYPEHWPEAQWERDASLMQKSGVSVVRLAEFAWHLFEPVEGQLQFDWLERALDVLSRHDVKAILCTPTPTYPAWMHRKYPDIHQIRGNGQVKEFGQRQDACKNHLGYREHAFRITEAVTEHFGNHPTVVAWQTDNELGCHGTARCYCANCERAFQSWLADRFSGDIDRLNEAWGTTFWSHTYNSFDEISLPRDTADRSDTKGQNPGLVLDFFRFSSDVQVDFNRELANIIRRNSPSRPVTHNLMGGFTDINYFDLADDLDVVSWDNYPFFQPQVTTRPPAPLPHALMRGFRKQNVWVMEQAAGQGGWERFFPTPEPGRMRLWAFQAVARGADFINFFRWRTARYGTEQYWHGILPHHGSPGPRLDEMEQFGRELARISEHVAGTAVESKVAIVFDYDSLWSLEIQPHSADGISFFTVASDYATALARLGVSFDIVAPGDDFSGYPALILPVQHVCTPELLQRLSSYVESGGSLLMGPRSCVKDSENAVMNEQLPAGLIDVTGCTVADYDAFSFVKDARVRVRNNDGLSWEANHLAELLAHAETAEILLRYEGRYYTDRVAAVRNPVGRGACTYLGTYLDANALVPFLTSVLESTPVKCMENIDPSVEITARSTADRTVKFYLNHAPDTRTIPLQRPGKNILTGKNESGTLTIAGLGVAVIVES